MYAVIEDGGKQYKVTEGETVSLERKDIEAGKSLEFGEVLLLSREGDIRLGQPYVLGAKVTGIAVEEIKAKKVVNFRYKAKKGYRRKIGHRQRQLLVKIEKILFP
jgi:large subunit ribosomal protein L21